MSSLATEQSLLVRLPRELCNSISVYALEWFGRFPKDWGAVDLLDKNALFRELPRLCQANRQVFNEATPIFLPRNTRSWNTATTKQLLNLYPYIPGDSATKGVEQFSILNWTEEGTVVQLELTSSFTNLRFLDLFFSFPSIVDGVPIEEYNYPNEQSLWHDTGLHYDHQHGRSIKEEKAVLAKDLEAFVTKFGLNRNMQMPKLHGMQFRFVAKGCGENAIGGKLYRHRLCNPLWRWASKLVVDKWGRAIWRVKGRRYTLQQLWLRTIIMSI